jgi:hypothetical protein
MRDIADFWGRPCRSNPSDPFRDDVEMSCAVSPIPPAKRPAPRIPRQHYTPPSARPVAVFVFVAIVSVLCAMALVDVAWRISL